jgi:hypothetical protein
LMLCPMLVLSYIIIDDCWLCAALWWVSLLTAIEACFVLPIFLIKNYATLAFATSATSTTPLSEWQLFR